MEYLAFAGSLLAIWVIGLATGRILRRTQLNEAYHNGWLDGHDTCHQGVLDTIEARHQGWMEGFHTAADTCMTALQDEDVRITRRDDT